MIDLRKSRTSRHVSRLWLSLDIIEYIIISHALAIKGKDKDKQGQTYTVMVGRYGVFNRLDTICWTCECVRLLLDKLKRKGISQIGNERRNVTCTLFF